MSFETLLTVFRIVAELVFFWMVITRLNIIHRLTNSGMGSALAATVVALRSDAATKHELARLIGGTEQLRAATVADIAVDQAEELLRKHNRGQAAVDRIVAE